MGKDNLAITPYIHSGRFRPRARGVVGYHARLAPLWELARGVRFNPGRVHILFGAIGFWGSLFFSLSLFPPSALMMRLLTTIPSHLLSVKDQGH